MKNRGLTLIELISTLVILAIVATIVFPNVYDILRDSKKDLYNMQLGAIEEAAKDWVANNYRELSTEDGEETFIFLKADLQDGAYIDSPLKNNKDGKEFNGNVFVVVTCEVVEADENNAETFKYNYKIYDTNEKHLTLLAQKYVKNNGITSDTTLTLSQLITYAHTNLKVSNSLKNIEDGTLISNATVNVTYSNGTYKYEVTVG